MSSSTGRAASPQPQPGGPAAGPPDFARLTAAPSSPGPPLPAPAAPVPAVPAPITTPAATLPAPPGPARGRAAANWPATAALVCGILGGALITIPAGLLLAGMGFRRARQGRRGLVRCWAAVALTLAWAGAAGYLVPHLVQAADPGCVAYKNTALTAYNRVADDVSGGRSRARLARDLTAAITTAERATADSQSAAATRSLAGVSGALRTMRTDVQAGRDVPRGLLLTLNRETRGADTACGTVRL